MSGILYTKSELLVGRAGKVTQYTSDGEYITTIVCTMLCKLTVMMYTSTGKCPIGNLEYYLDKKSSFLCYLLSN